MIKKEHRVIQTLGIFPFRKQPGNGFYCGLTAAPGKLISVGKYVTFPSIRLKKKSGLLSYAGINMSPAPALRG